jgi:transposase InsO family protein
MLRLLLFSGNHLAPTGHSLLLGTAADITRSRSELLLENALLRQQLVVLQRQVKRPKLNNKDRFILALLASKLRNWKSALLIVQPDTLLHWHRVGFRLLWKRKSSPSSSSPKPKLAAETIELIKQLARDNRLWGAERIRGELLKLDIRVAKRTIQKYMRGARATEPTDGKRSQTWSTFLHNHAAHIWACDFLQVYDLFFRPLFIFFIIELGTRRVVHLRVTRNPSDEWTAQQLREATPYGEQPKYLIRDNDTKFGAAFSRVAAVSGIKELRIAYKAPKMNAFCERFLGSVRRECLDHLLILSERHLHEILKEYIEYFNRSRPHQGIGQGIPAVAAPPEGKPAPESAEAKADGRVIAFPVLGGLHHDYRKAA